MESKRRKETENNFNFFAIWASKILLQIFGTNTKKQIEESRPMQRDQHKPILGAKHNG